MPVVVLGPIEAVIHTALLVAWATDFELQEYAGVGLELAQFVLACAAVAVVVPPDDLDDVANRVNPDVFVFGVSSADFDVRVRQGNESRVLANPSPRTLANLVLSGVEAGRAPHRRDPGTRC